MKIEEIKNMKKIELKERLINLKDDLMKIRYQLSIGQMENTKKIKLHKKDIARIETVMSELQNKKKI
ncbi:MAG: 50S ribosomal protein L29 [bacterium]